MFEKQTKDKTTVKRSKVERYITKKGQHRFRVIASNGKIVAVSEGYNSKKGCMNGIYAVQRAMLELRIVEVEK